MNFYTTYIEIIIRNPLCRWIKWYLSSRLYIIKNREKNICIKNMAKVENSRLGFYNTIYDYAEIQNSIIDDFTYISANTKINKSIIGRFSSIGPDVKIGLGIHPTDFVSTSPVFYSTRKQCQISFVEKTLTQEYGTITIGNDVWIGANALIMDNIKVGDGAIIAAGAVVTKDVEPYSVVAGVPAKKIKQRFDNEKIKMLMELKWWNKELIWITENIDKFSNINHFLQ